MRFLLNELGTVVGGVGRAGRELLDTRVGGGGVDAGTELCWRDEGKVGGVGKARGIFESKSVVNVLNKVAWVL